MYFLSIKRYNFEYTKSEKTREWDQSLYNYAAGTERYA